MGVACVNPLHKKISHPGTSVERIFCGAYILWHVLVCIKHLACPATKTTVRNITLCIINFTYYNLYGNIMRGKYYISIFTSLSLFPLTIMCLYYVPIYKIIFYIYIGECVCLCVYPSKHYTCRVCGPIGTKFGTHMQIHQEKVVGKIKICPG